LTLLAFSCPTYNKNVFVVLNRSLLRLV